MGTIKYQYAYDENDNIIDINNIYPEYRKEHTFHCIGCNGKMKANFCKIKADYFSHYGDSCSSETYLHELAKKVFKQKFENNAKLLLEYEQYDLCHNYKTCIFYKFDICSKKICREYNLKEFYNKCQEEQPIKNFKADLLLSDATGKYKAPILVEIFVTHKCTEEKINSGFRIIEIKINSDLDIRTLLNQPIKGDSEQIKLYGFKRESQYNVQLNNRKLRKITFYKDSKYKVKDNNCCSISNVKNESESLAEIYLLKTEYIKDVSLATLLARDVDFNLRNCFLCKYSKYYERKLRIHPNCLYWQNPSVCNLYEEDSEKVGNIRRNIEGLQVVVNLWNEE